jgi:nicotinamide-nucleotide amidase
LKKPEEGSLQGQFEEQVQQRVVEVAKGLIRKGWLLSCAESCTGGWISKCCTDLAGSSAWFDSGLVTYSYPAKTSLLGVTEERLLQFGAVSQEVVSDMAVGALVRTAANVSLAVTGIAGPGGGMAGKPVGTVWFAWAVGESEVETEVQVFSGHREEIRQQTVLYALGGLLKKLG